jgi:hypothetical protein
MTGEGGDARTDVDDRTHESAVDDTPSTLEPSDCTVDVAVLAADDVRFDATAFAREHHLGVVYRGNKASALGLDPEGEADT